jgi:hypothetical protein
VLRNHRSPARLPLLLRSLPPSLLKITTAIVSLMRS